MERLIREFFHKKGSGFVLKGGGAVRTLFGEQRLTRDVDLDFTNPKRTVDSLHNTVNRAIRAAARGLPMRDLRVAGPRKGELSPRWKINFEDQDGESFHVEVEVSRDAARVPPGLVVQKRFVPDAAVGIGRFWVDIYDEPALIASKLAALLGREVPRDVYDLDLLMTGSASPSEKQLRWAIERAGLEGEDPLAVLKARMEGLDWARFATDLRDTLLPHIAERIDEAEWEAIKGRVSDYAENLLQTITGRRA